MPERKPVIFDLINFIYLLCGMLVIFMMMFSAVLFAQNAYAGVTTDNPSIRVMPGPATLTPGEPKIDVTVFYTGDDISSNNSITIEWGVDGGAYTGSFTSAVHPASPYTYSITSLDNSVIYQVKTTITDPDNIPTTISKEFKGVKTYNPLLHNAVSTGSGTSKWASGWGIAGGQYGEFSCSVCHEKKSGNIKRIRKDWSVAGLPAVPANQHGDSIDFTTNIDGSAEYALDDTTDHSTSNRICEACHTLTNHHRHDESAVPSSDHQSTKDCTSCHKHQNAFATSGGCSSCHGGNQAGSTESNFWPDSGIEDSDGPGSADDSGEHAVHMTRLAQEVLGQTIVQLLNDSDSYNKQLQLCNYCHENPGGDGDHMSGDDAEVTRFLNMAGGAEAGTTGSYSAAADTCSNVDCHNGKDLQVANNWYAGSNPTDTTKCLLCHTADGSNSEALVDPVSGLHYHATPGGVILHDDNFSSSGDCLTCHSSDPSSGHFNSNVNTADQATFNFQSSAAIDVKLNDLGDVTDDTCAADCHSDGGAWYRIWSADAFDSTSVNITQALPARCNVCHGVFNYWAEGSSHAQTYEGVNSIVGNSHNSQNPIDNPGATCEDCHNYPSDSARHENGFLTINDDTGSAVDPIEVPEGTYCAPCHAAPSIAADYPPEATSEVIPHSVFPREYRDNGSNYPIESCFSGAVGCHGDKAQRWWPSADWAADPANPARFTIGETNYGYPNRAGAHPQHNVTLGTLVAETRGGPGTTPTDQDFNSTCRFCHPMEQNAYGSWVVPDGKHRDGITDMYGGYKFDTANEKGLVLSGDPVTGSWTNYNTYPNATDGYLYQLDNPENPGSLYPLDRDVVYRQFLYEYRDNPAVNHATCAQIACHSNAPFTPQWYGDEQPPAAISDLAGATHDMRDTHVAGETDNPGTVLLTWSAPGDNGDLDGTSHEYEVYYSTGGTITDLNVGSATRVGGVPTVYRKGSSQEMVVDGLTPGTNYWLAVRTKDQPRFKDTNGDGVYETFVADGNVSTVASVGPITAHVDDVDPLFWGINAAVSHDTGGEINLSWEAAKDHTVPITYRVYWSEYSLKTHLSRGGTLPSPSAAADSGSVETQWYSINGGGVPTEGGSDYYIKVMSTHAIHYQITSLTEGVLYNFLVRAADGVTPTPNVDDNSIVSMVLPKEMPVEQSTLKISLIDNNDELVPVADIDNITEWPGTNSITLNDGASNTWRAQSAYSVDTNIVGISFDVFVSNTDKLSKDIVYTLGHDNASGTDFQALGGADSISVGKKSTRLQKVSLYGFQGKVVAGRYLALRIQSSGGDLTYTFGDSSNKGQLLVNEQLYNHQPSGSGPIITEQASGGYLDVDWGTYSDNDSGTQTIHYDLFGSADGGSTYPYVIATGVAESDDLNGAATGRVTWDTVGDGLTSDAIGVKVKLEVGEETQHQDTDTSTVTHLVAESALHTLNNGSDDEAPAAPYISHVEPRPKLGSTYLHWLAVGNDGYNHGTRAAYYDVRFRKVSDGALTAGNWNDAATTQAEGEPVPGFSGHGETYELLGMTPDTDYQVALIACDADNNCSGLSNVYTITSGQYYCGICHSTPPDEPDTGGVHRQHGYTLEDCAKCHGDGTSPDGNDVQVYDGRHYDGVINIGWAEQSDGTRATLIELAAESGGSGVTVTQNNGSSVTIYNDPDGAGGYNAGTAYNAGEPLKNTDSGKCMNFGPANASGCHGPFQPKWASDTVEAQAIPTCADCHGDKTMVANDDAGTELGRLTDPYGRQWDQVDTSQAQISGYYPPEEELLASPPVDNHNLGGKDTRYTGAHLRHLNASFRFAKGDSCRLCHKDTMDAGLHANRVVEVVFDAVADQDDANPAIADDTPVDVDTKGISCSSLNNLYCHDTGARWAEPGTKCNDCHGMGSKEYTPGSTPSDGGVVDLGHVRLTAGGSHVQCTACHYAGHPQSPDGKTPGVSNALLIENYPAVGISYRSGGIHLKNYVDTNLNDVPDGGETQYSTLAELCWDCHEQQGVSEWGANTRVITGNSPYDYGSVDTGASGIGWYADTADGSEVGATWSSKYTQFSYKTGAIQSTHSTNLDGTSEIVGGVEKLDKVANIRCSNCHDVHDLNRADGDTMTGQPYLRGTWMGNPYEEDGAPYTGRTYSSPNRFGAIPRGGVEYDQLGGYYIDQNNAVPGTGLNANPTPDRYPTSGWTIYSSAGLCVLCHGDNVDTLDQRTGENLWLGTNGHSNSALGGTFINSENIFDYTHGRPTPVTFGMAKSDTYTTMIPDMGTQAQGTIDKAKGVGYRGDYSTSYTGYYTPRISSADYAYEDFDWGCSVDQDSTDVMFHQFSCSKCHSPHASRLPKLMITNCLDIRHNTWDDSMSSQSKYTAHADYGNDGTDDNYRSDLNKKTAYYESAQNCHRYDGSRSTDQLKGGWNKATPW